MTMPVVPHSMRASFSFPEAYLDQWRTFDVPMTATGLVTMLRTYSSIKEDGRPESWFDISRRVVEGAFSLYRYHCRKHGVKPDADFETKWSRKMFESMMRLEWCPAGRGLQHMGHARMWDKGGAVLNSCAFVTTLNDRDAEWVYFLADMSMLGVGVGYDTRGAGATLCVPRLEGKTYKVEDTREGWATILRMVVEAHMETSRRYHFPMRVDFSGLRPKGAPLLSMGGISSGPGPLVDAVQRMFRILDPSREMTLSEDGLLLSLGSSTMTKSILTAEQILDIGNAVGVCVVSGGIRRSAEICLFDSRPESEEVAFTAKQDKDKLMEYRWASNNSIKVSRERSVEFFKRVVESCSTFGDPGLLFENNINGSGRVGERNEREMRAVGTNPCVTGDTIVATKSGLRRVEELVGTPFSFEHEGRTWRSTEQGFWETKKTSELVAVRFSDGSEVMCTPDHLFPVIGKGDVRASALVPDQEVPLHMAEAYRDKTTTKVVSVERVLLEAPVAVYDCTIPGLNYFPANGVMVHNCGEQVLESYELCNLVETVPGRGHHPTSAQCAFLYGKLVSLLPIHYARTRHIVERNRRVGTSLTGWIEHAFPALPRTQEWLGDFLDESYGAIRTLDRAISGKVLVGVPTSIKTTSVKPSGSVSLVLGTSPGMNAHFAPYYIRRINIENSSPLLEMLKNAGYPAVPNIYSPTSHVVEFPCQTTSRTDFSAIDQLETVKLLQHKWSDNMVSNTIVFDDSEVDAVAQWVYDNQDWLRSLSFLRRQHSFEQAPLEAITPEEYHERAARTRPLSSINTLEEGVHDISSEDKWCDGGRCVIGEVSEVSEPTAGDAPEGP